MNEGIFIGREHRRHEERTGKEKWREV